MTPPMEIAAWLACLLFVVGLVNQMAKLKDNVFGSKKQQHEITPQPLQVQAVGDLVKEKDCVMRHGSIEAQIVELRHQRIQDAKDWSASRGKLYEQIESVRKELPEMERRLNAADEERTGSVHDRVNDILEAVGELRGEVNRIAKVK